MRRWIQILLGVTLVGVVVQVVLYFNRGPVPWHLPFASDTALNTSSVLNTSSSSAGEQRQHSASSNASSDGRHELESIIRNGGAPDQNSVTRKSVSDKRHRHHTYLYLLNEPRACTSHTELVMVVITAIKNGKDRQAVRDTWGSYRTDPHHNTSMVFLVGATSNASLQAQLVQESHQHHDIVQEDFIDSYRNLSLKSLAMLKWVTTFCNSSKYVLKVDDDMYINVPNLIAALRKESLSHSIFVLGHIFQGSRPRKDKNSKWYTTQTDFNETVYPRYTSGTAYSMTMSAAKKLYAASAQVPLFWLEDIYVTGLCSQKAGVKRYHHSGFNYIRQELDGCFFRKAISGHKYTAADKRTIFKKVHDPNLKC